MRLYEKYISGETKEVYQEIFDLGQAAFLSTNFIEVDKILTETFKRVAFNLDIIYKELNQINYLFKANPNYSFEMPLHNPLANTKDLLAKLDEAVKDFGYIPLSLKYFYQIVGGVNFVWDYQTNEEFLWDMADPIQVASLDSIVEEVTEECWKEDVQQYVDDEEFGVAFLELSADDLHKDNISGGQPYSLEITKEKSIDGRFLNEPNNTTFIDYLRIVFDYCGFVGNPDNESYKKFVERVKPKLKQI